MDMVSNLLSGLIGVLLGWALTEVFGYLKGRRESESALWLFEGELQMIRTQATFAKRYMEKAQSLQDKNLKQAEQHRDWAQAMVRSLPAITAYKEKFDAIARRLNNDEIEIAQGVVTYYSAMRAASPEKLPYLDGMQLLEIIITTRRHLARPRPFSRVFYRRKVRELKDRASSAAETFRSRAASEGPIT